MGLRAVFPGSFDPLTVAHVAMAAAARAHATGLVQVDFAMSSTPLGKDIDDQRPVAQRRAAISSATAPFEWLGVVVVHQQLVVDIAADYDHVILGADKWEQLFDPSFYGEGADMHASLERLCPAIVFSRPGHTVTRLREVDIALELAADLRPVSSSAVRAGRTEWRYTREDRGS